MRCSLLFPLVLALVACGGSIPVPTTGPHLGDTPVAVPSMPPPGKVEIVGAPPATLKRPVWIDGEWLWTGRRWQWKEGRWEEPQGDYWAPAITVRLADGSMAHFKGAWKGGAAPK
ncbi:Hypothetical protein A7982_09414 [Minicystis rosea]|nr:Hypothetical protein A7982_09414 [Minicystis rosea]